MKNPQVKINENSFSKQSRNNTFTQIIYFLIGSPQECSLEHRLFSAVTLLNALANIGGVISLLFLKLEVIAVINVLVGVVFFGFYYLSRYYGRHQQLYWPYIIVTAFFVFITSLQSAGTNGGGHYYLIAGVVIAIIVANNRKQIYWSILLFGFLSLLLLGIEGYEILMGVKTGFILEYLNRQAQIVDVAGNFIFVQILIVVLVLVLKGSMNEERQKGDKLLLNILPQTVADELKKGNRVQPQLFQNTTVLFTDFVGFTKSAEKLSPQLLINLLDNCFSAFDNIIARHKLEKIKTIGDSYMAVAGIPMAINNHAVYAVLAALKMQEFMKEYNINQNNKNEPILQMRVGLHSGAIVAGIVGYTKFAYDVWGDTVNTASRMESAGIAGGVNVSEDTYNLIKNYVDCEYRGDIEAKNKGKVKMYLVRGLRSELITKYS